MQRIQHPFRFGSKQFLLLFLFVLCIAFSTTKVHGQDLAHYRIDYEDGLPSNEVYQTLQDPFGFIWIGCDAGLFRYDGFRFIEYSNEQLNSRSISNLKLDTDGNLWCQNFTGQILRVRNDKLDVFYDGSNSSSQYPAYTIDKQNRIWISSDQAIRVFNQQQKTIKRIQNKELAGKPINWLVLQTVGESVVAVDLMSNFYSFNTNSFKVVKLKMSQSIGDRHMLFNNANELVVFTERNPVREYSKSCVKNGNVVLQESFTPQINGGIHYFFKTIGAYDFMGTSDGLMYRLKASTSTSTAFRRCFKGMKISDVQRDREGNYWVASLQDGIIVVPSMSIKSYQKSNSVLTDNNLSHLAKYKNTLLIGSNSGGIFEYNRVCFSSFQQNTSATYRAIRKIVSYQNKIIIACGPIVAPEIPWLNELGSLYNIRDMEIMHDRLYFTSPDRTGFVELKNNRGTVQILRKRGGKKLVIDRKNNKVYFACTDGLFSYSEGKVRPVYNSDRYVFASDLAIFNDSLWVGTMNDGLIVRSLDNGRFHSLEQLNGKHIRCMKFTQRFAWIATEIGLNRFDFINGRSTLFNEQDGIDFLEINDIEVYKNKVYLATIRGLLSFPSFISGTNSVAPNIRLLGVRIGKNFIKNPKGIELDYKERDVVIQFQAAAFRSKGTHYFEYRISNYANSWKKINASSPSITINGLPSGKYEVEIRAVNEDGYKSKRTLIIPVTVLTPFYFTWWFITLTVVVILLCFALILRYRIRFVQQKAEARNELLRSQITALKAQMNPHFMYNTLSSIQDFIWQNDTKNSNYYLSRFSLLMRKILDASDESRISLSEELEILNLYLELEQLRFGDSFIYQMHVSEEVDTDRIFIPAMIIQPFIENAIKHGLLHKQGDKRLEVAFSIVNNQLHCSIKDNGIGRKKAEEIKLRQSTQHKSFATKATKKRIDLLSLYDDSHYNCEIIDLYNGEEALGTFVQLVLPFHHS